MLRVLQPGTVLGGQRLRHFVHHVVGNFAREKRQIVGVERQTGLDQLVSSQFLNKRSANSLARFDQRGASLLGFELTKHQEAIVSGQRIKDDRDVGGMLRLEMTLQLDEILSMLHLLEQVVARGLLPAGERGQHPMAVQQTHDLVTQALHRLTRSFGRHDSNSLSWTKVSWCTTSAQKGSVALAGTGLRSGNTRARQ